MRCVFELSTFDPEMNDHGLFCLLELSMVVWCDDGATQRPRPNRRHSLACYRPVANFGRPARVRNVVNARPTTTLSFFLPHHHVYTTASRGVPSHRSRHLIPPRSAPSRPNALLVSSTCPFGSHLLSPPPTPSLAAWRILNRKVLLVGGGVVATGRLYYLLEAGAKVTLISPRRGLTDEVKHRIDVEKLVDRYEDREWEDKDGETLRGRSCHPPFNEPLSGCQHASCA